MRLISLLPFAAALAGGADALNLSSMISANPSLSRRTPTPTPTVNRPAIASSIVSQLNQVRPTTTVSRTTTTVRTTTTRTTTTRRTTTTPRTTTTRRTTTTTTRRTIIPARSVVASRVAKRQLATQVSSVVSQVGGAVSTVASVVSSAVGAVESLACLAETGLQAYVPVLNTAQGFLLDTTLLAVGQNTSQIAGYTRNFTDQYGSMFAPNYIQFWKLPSYNASLCAAYCDLNSACQSFNIYYEREPSVIPGASCPNPAAGVSVKCALFGSSINVSQARNVGQWRYQFMVVIQSSAGYLRNVIPSVVTNYTAPAALPGAVNTNSSLLAQNYVSGTFNVSVCASQCTNFTATARAGALASGNLTYSACNYFNAFTVSQNGANLGYYCGLYANATVASSAGTVSTSTFNGLTYDLTNSYGYALSTPDSGTLPPRTFRILSAYFADTDITTLARSAFIQNNGTSLNIDTTFPGSLGLPTTDPWTGISKSISILYTYGLNETRVFTSFANQGVLSQTNAFFQSLTAPASTLIPDVAVPSGSGISIQAVVWGPSQVTSSFVYSNLYSRYSSRLSFTLINSFFGVDTAPGVTKSAVIFYLDANGNQRALAGKQAVTVSFPTT